MIGAELALTLFAACNGARVLAYVPQIVRVVRDASGAKAISCTTWSMFGVSHLSTATYALSVVEDWSMVAIFTANTACCAAIVGTTVYKRRGDSEAGISSGGATAMSVRRPVGTRRSTIVRHGPLRPPPNFDSEARDLRAEYLGQLFAACLQRLRNAVSFHLATLASRR